MNQEKEVMLEEIRLQPGFVRENIRPMLQNLVEELKKHDISKTRHVFVLGCGDSYFSALANRVSFMEMTGLFVEPIEALEFSRFVVEHMPAGSAVIGVSNSGTVSRTIEGVKRAREKGALTFAITTSEKAPLAQAVDIPLIVNSPPNIKERPGSDPVVTPGTVTYIASLLGVYSVGLSFGLTTGTVTQRQADDRIDELMQMASTMQKTIETVEQPVRDYANSLPSSRRIMILGGGPNYSTALFGMAKLFESLRHPASAVEMEEWAHEEYFVSDADAEVIVVVPPGGTRDRALEQMRAAREMGAHVVAIAREGDKEVEAAADVLFPVPGDIREPLSPFVYSIPFGFLGCHLSIARGRAFLGFDDSKRREVNFRQIFKSKSTATEAVK